MASLYQRTLKYKSFVFLIFAMLFYFINLYQQLQVIYETHLDVYLIKTHLITLLVANVYFLYKYIRLYLVNSILCFSILRLGRDKLIHQVLYFESITTIVFVSFVYLVPFLILNVWNHISILFLYFLTIQFLLYLVYDVIFIYCSLLDKNRGYFLIPVIMNFFVHYILLPVFL